MIVKYLKKLLITFVYYSRIFSNERIAQLIGVKIGERCRLLDNPLKLFGSEPYLIAIGNHVEITSGCRFITHDGAFWCFRDRPEYSNLDYFAPIRIGDNVFIGMNSVILPGVTVGGNCIIGAGTLVTKDVPSGSVFAGVPGKVIKSLTEYESKLVSSLAFQTKHMSYEKKYYYLLKNKAEWFK